MTPHVTCRIPRRIYDVKFETILQLREACMQYLPFRTPHVYLNGLTDSSELEKPDRPDYRLVFEFYRAEDKFHFSVIDEKPISFVGTPGQIVETGTLSDGRPYRKVHTEYVDMVSGKSEWSMTYTDAPRTLTYFGREQIPVMRDDFIREMMIFARNRLERKSEMVKGNVDPAALRGGVHTRKNRIEVMEYFLLKVADTPWFQTGRLSPEFIQNARNSWAHIIGMWEYLNDLHWKDDAVLQKLRGFFTAIDPTVQTNGPVDSVLWEQWRRWAAGYFLGQGRAMPYGLNETGVWLWHLKTDWPGVKHAVVEGDTLSAIALTYLGDAYKWRELASFNRETVPNPDLIYPGQVINIPRL